MPALFLALVALVGCTRTPPEREGPVDNVVLIVIDTLRADVWEEVDTPEYDRFARRGSRARRAWSPATWTAPGVISLFTGAHVREHGWDHPFPDKLPSGKRYGPVPDVPVLAEVLRDHGFIADGRYANPLLGRDLGFRRGFRSWRVMRTGEQSEWVAREIRRWEPGERHFLYLHMWGCHSPLVPTWEKRLKYGLDPRRDARVKFGIRQVDVGDPAELDTYRRAYRAEAEDVDALLGWVLRALAPVMDTTAVVITSDHGEMLGEHDHLGHGSVVWEGVTGVPLAAWNTEPLPPVVSALVAADLLTRAAGIDHDWPVRVDDPGPLVSQREGKVAFSADGRTKGIWDPDALPDGPRGFDLERDPQEARPGPLDAALARARVDWEARTLGRRAEAQDGELDGETLDVLEALGYVEETDEAFEE